MGRGQPFGPLRHLIAVTTTDTAAAPSRAGELFAAHHLELCRWAALLLGDAHRAEEVVMEAFATLMSRESTLRDPAKALTYLRSCVLNGARSHWRREQRERRANARALTSGRDDGSGPPAWEDRDVILRALGTLPHRQRAAAVLRYYSDLPDAEIAEILGVSIGTVKSQLHKARTRLAEALREER
jgi:RNA polymerase sigma-70 factor (sigma-E family)